MVEEPRRLQHEFDAVGRHDRPVLGSGDVVTAQGVPEHDVGVLDRAVGLRAGGESGAAAVLVRVIARWEPLIGLERGDPQMFDRGRAASHLSMVFRGGQQWSLIYTVPNPSWQARFMAPPTSLIQTKAKAHVADQLS